MLGDSNTMLMGLLIFLAAGTLAFSLMAAVRVRGAVKKRTARIMNEQDAGEHSRSLQNSSARPSSKLIDYTTKHYVGQRREHEGAAPAACPGRHLRSARRRFLLHRADALAIGLAAAVFLFLPLIRPTRRHDFSG